MQMHISRLWHLPHLFPSADWYSWTSQEWPLGYSVHLTPRPRCFVLLHRKVLGDDDTGLGDLGDPAVAGVSRVTLQLAATWLCGA